MRTIVEAQHGAEPEKAFDARSRICPHACCRSCGRWYQQLWTGQNHCGIGSISRTLQCTQPDRKKRRRCRAGTNLTSTWKVPEFPGFPKSQLICVGIMKSAFMAGAQCMPICRTHASKASTFSKLIPALITNTFGYYRSCTAPGSAGNIGHRCGANGKCTFPYSGCSRKPRTFPANLLPTRGGGRPGCNPHT